MFFSVVITVYENDQIFLPRVMTGLLNQTFKDFEVIVVVDGEVRFLHTTRTWFAVRRSPRPWSIGPGATRSGSVSGISHSNLRGEYAVWLNADNLVYPNWLQCHHENALESPGDLGCEYPILAATKLLGRAANSGWPMGTSICSISLPLELPDK